MIRPRCRVRSILAREKKIGPTLCVNPGSEAGSGIVRGYLIDVSSDGVERSFRVEG